MKLMAWIVDRRHYAYVMAVLVAGGLLFGNGGLQEQRISAQAANSMYVTPASGNHAVGSTFTVSIRENSAVAINVAQAELKYSSGLEFVSIDGAGSAFAIDASSVGGNGLVTISRGLTGSVSGDQLISKVTFRVIAAGTATIEVLGGSELVSIADSQAILKVRTGGSYNLQASGATAPIPVPPTSTPTTPTTNPGRGTTTSSNNRTTSPPSVTIASEGSSQATPLPGDSVVELEAAATIETVTNADRPVEKVEYILNGKVVATDTTPPYSHALDTTNMRNGTYSLVTKTYYEQGDPDTSEASVVVKNAFGIKQFWLQAKHYAWIIIILVIVIGELIYLKFFRGRNQNGQPPIAPGGGVGNYPVNNSGHGTVVVGSGSSYEV